ncbi:MAG: DNA-processing protein DprA [Armatimonadota bacterium]
MPDIENWIRLAMLESPRNAIAIIDYFGTPEEAFNAHLQDFIEIKGVTRRTAEKFIELGKTSVDKELKALVKLNASVVTYRDAEYPYNLKQISDPPVVLFVRGSLHEQDRFSIAVIGTRKPSEYGKSMAYKISRDLAKRGLTLISGGARGIDTVAHTAVLDTGGRTVAVLGSGLDVPYPYENRKMLDSIAETGAVISEFIPGTKPDAWRFPVRNRIVSGMSLGVLVVESLLTGGAMITANVALEQGRDVWAVPGTTDTPASQGPHRLIKDGAKLIECVEDILEELGLEKDMSTRQETVKVPDNLSAEQKTLVMALSLHPKHIDEIISECSLSPASASSNLTLLEMLGLVRRVPGNSYVRVV